MGSTTEGSWMLELKSLRPFALLPFAHHAQCHGRDGKAAKPFVGQPRCQLSHHTHRQPAQRQTLRSNLGGPQPSASSSTSMEQELAKDACLGAALLDDLKGQEHQTGVPSAWRVVFADDHADAPVFMGLFSSCQSGREFALKTAPRLKVQLTLPSHPPPGLQLAPLDPLKWQYQLTAVQKALQTRGQRPVSFALNTKGGAWSAADLLQVPQYINGNLAESIKQCDLKFGHWAKGPTHSIVTSFIGYATTNYVNLTALSIQAHYCILPLGPKLPHLSKLAINATVIDESVCLSIVPYMSQVRSLQVSLPLPDNAVPWDVLFNAETKAHSKITEFKTNVWLNIELVEPLQEYAPATLKHLSFRSVYGVRPNGPDHPLVYTIPRMGHLQWPVERITVTGPIEIWLLARVPKSYSGKTDIYIADMHAASAFSIMGPEGLSERVVARLPDWRFMNPLIPIAPSPSVFSLGPATERTALTNVLQQLRDMQAPHSTILFADWHWSDDTQQMILTALPTLSHLTFGIKSLATMTDSMLSGLMKAPNCRLLAVRELALTKGQRGNVAWPWEDLAIVDVDVVQLLCLPHPRRAGGGRRDMGFQTLVFSGVNEACGARLCKWLQHVTWKPMNAVAGAKLVFSVPTGQYELKTARAQLSTLKAVRFTKPEDTMKGLAVGFSARLTPKMMQLLRDLPDGPRVLDLQGCSWPQGATEYRALTQHVPASYTEWRLDVGTGTSLLQSICDGVNEHRGRVGMGPVRLALYGYKGAEMKVGEHVIVTGLTA